MPATITKFSQISNDDDIGAWGNVAPAGAPNPVEA
jgi:hypothetical protein